MSAKSEQVTDPTRDYLCDEIERYRLRAEKAEAEVEKLRKLAHTFTVNGKWIDLASVEELWNEVVELRAEKKRLMRALTDYTQDA